MVSKKVRYLKRKVTDFKTNYFCDCEYGESAYFFLWIVSWTVNTHIWFIHARGVVNKLNMVETVNTVWSGTILGHGLDFGQVIKLITIWSRSFFMTSSDVEQVMPLMVSDTLTPDSYSDTHSFNCEDLRGIPTAPVTLWQKTD